MFGGSQRARSRLRVPWGISPLIQSKPAGSVLAFHLATVSQVLWLLLSLWGWWCSRALTIPVLQILCMPVLTTRGIAQEFQKVNLCQDSKISILPSVCGCFFTTSLPLAFFWWNCLSFKSLVLSPASMFLLCNHYRAYISTPDSLSLTPRVPVPGSHSQTDHKFGWSCPHALRQPGGISVCKT